MNDAKKQLQLNHSLITAARSGEAKKIAELVAAGADLEFVDQQGYDKRALHWTAQGGHTDAVKTLVRAGAEIDADNRYKRTPLFIAAWFGHFHIAYYLWRHGANKHHLDKWGEQAGYTYAVPDDIKSWLNKERENRTEPEPVFEGHPGLVTSDDE